MKPTPEMEAKGLKAYEQAHAFERLRSWRLPLTYAFFLVVPLASGAGAYFRGNTPMAALNLVAAVVLGLIMAWHWSRLKARYAQNTLLLAELERLHGIELPWVQVERHFAALEKLKQELAEEKAARSR